MIKDITIDWHLDCGNFPTFQVEMPIPSVYPRPDARYTKRVVDGQNYYFTSAPGGYADFLVWTPPHNNGGFCKAEYKIPLEDGSIEVVKGPWSTRSGVLNQLGFGPCVEVVFNRQIAGACLVNALVDFLQAHPEKDFGICREEIWGGEVYYHPCTKDNRRKPGHEIEALERIV